MAAPKGNVYYQLAKSFVKPKSYKPNTLWLKAIEYFEWNEKHPLKEVQVFGSGKRMSINKIRAMTISGFCNFACIDRSTFENYEKDKDYFRICSRVREIIYQQKLEGSAAGLLNPSIIAREIGLADKQEITGKDGKPIKTESKMQSNIDYSKLPNEVLLALLKARKKQDG